VRVAQVNDYDVRMFRAEGEFPQHSHPETDELFLVIDGSLTIRLEDREIELGPGQLYVVPRGVPHQPYSQNGATALLLEPSATENTGDTPSEFTRVTRDL
jgi:mannose-6-phosphate isomerase-like protein (cupin superfamily)